ncbi:hypothetical protein GGR58DRAFT_503134 [Xylaria digitata]|nr:hypothetical protein GGR58DRAFT_503134 [Xylaria digitata]
MQIRGLHVDEAETTVCRTLWSVPRATQVSWEEIAGDGKTTFPIMAEQTALELSKAFDSNRSTIHRRAPLKALVKVILVSQVIDPLIYLLFQQSVREFYRSGAPPPSTLSSHHTELREALGKISDPEASLFVKSDIGGESQFSDDAEPNSRTATPRSPGPNQRPTPSTSALIPPEGYQHASAVVPRKRKAISDGKTEEAILQMKRILDAQAAAELMQNTAEHCIPPSGERAGSNSPLLVSIE